MRCWRRATPRKHLKLQSGTNAENSMLIPDTVIARNRRPRALANECGFLAGRTDDATVRRPCTNRNSLEKQFAQNAPAETVREILSLPHNTQHPR